jgi:hypothetical protein
MQQRLQAQPLAATNQPTAPPAQVPQQPSPRIHYLDWLRVLALLGVFLYHAVHPFDTLDWHVKNADQSQLRGVGRLDRWADDLGADRAPDVVQDTGELTVAESGEFSWRQSAHSGLDHSRCNSVLPAVRPERQLGAEPAPAGERRGHGDRR